MTESVNDIREKGIKTLLKRKITQTVDYLKDDTGLDKSNFIEYKTKDFTFIIRPSGTEPKLKVYYSVKATDKENAEKLFNQVKTDFEKFMK
jgi:phosphomannomutase